jgi:hypothetical protein
MRLWVRARIGAMVGLGGAAVMAAIGFAHGGGGRLLWHELPFVACAFAGATAAGLLLAPFFGGGGRRGALRATLGAVGATLGGAGLGGAAAFGFHDPLVGVVLGPIFVASSILSSLPVAAAWISSMALAHFSPGRLAPGEARRRPVRRRPA